MTGRDTVYGVFFNTDEDQIDIGQVRSDFQKYGKIAFVTQVQNKVFVNFIKKEDAEHCLSDSPDPKYGRLRRGKFGSGESQNSKEINSENSYKRNENITHSGSQRQYHSIITTATQTKFVHQNHYESKHSSDGPPPIQSANSGPLPLLSLNIEPPPLISAVEMNLPLPTRSSFNGPTQRPALLPTPPMYKRYNFNPEGLLPSPDISSQPVQDLYEDMPPLVSAISQPRHQRRGLMTNLSYEDYVKKYGNYILIINIPDDITTEEIEKILYPYIPVCVGEPELTDGLRLLYCLVTYKSKTEATKAVKQFDGVEIRGQCLCMVRLDELLLYDGVPC